MQTGFFRWVLVCLIFGFLAVALGLKADVNINILGFRYESKSETGANPSLELKIRTEDPTVSGTWQARRAVKPRTGIISIWCTFQIHHGGGDDQFGATISPASHPFLFADDKRENINDSFALVSGELVLQGKDAGKSGSGVFTFTPGTNYIEQASSYLKGRPTAVELLKLGLLDVTLSEIKAFHEQGFVLTVAELIRLKGAGVTPKYAAAVNKGGPFSFEEIIRLRNSGVTESFPKQLKEAGYNFNATDLVKLRNSGVSGDQAVAWKKAGFNLDAHGLITLRNSGVDPESSRKMKIAQPQVTTDGLIKMRNSGVSADDTLGWKEAGFNWSPDELIKLRNSGVSSDMGKAFKGSAPNIGCDEMIRLRNSGVTADYLSQMKGARGDLSSEEIIRLRNSGVSADYIASWKQAGANYSAEDLVKLRNSGVPSDYASAVNVPGRKPLSVDTLIRLRNRGLSAEEIRELRE